MKRLLLLILLVLVPTAASAGMIDRDVLVTSDGTVYSIVSEPIGDGSAGTMSSELALTVQRGVSITRVVVPETLNSGINWRPALAYDADSKTLLLVWLRMPNAMSSEILVASYQNGKWEPAVSIDAQPYLVRYNLSVGITRRVSRLQPDGSFADGPALLLHAAWWEQSGQGEAARYALLNVEKGAIRSIELHDLRDFINAAPATAVPDPNADRELIRHVAVLDGPEPNSIDVLFADPKTSTFHRVTLKPIADARVRIPVGSRPDGPGEPMVRFAAAKSLPTHWSGRTSTIASRDGKTIVFCNTLSDRVSYLSYNSTQNWSNVKEIALNDTVTADVAISALGRMIAAQ